MISLNTPIGTDGYELLHTVGVRDRSIDHLATNESLGKALRRLQPAERAALVEIRSGNMDLDKAAKILGKSRLGVQRLLNAATRKAVGRKRRSGVSAPGAGIEHQIGTVRERRRGEHKARYIKIRMTGKNRWILYARWLWEKHRGPVPADKQVLHVDGNSLNDAIDNLTLGGHSDRAFLFQSRSEANFAKTMAACRAGCRRHNRERAIARDMAGEIRAGKWYAVDHGSRKIIGPLGKRTIAEAYRCFGITDPLLSSSCSPWPWVASQLGWPSESSMVAILLAALACRPDHHWNRTETTTIIKELTARIGRPLPVTVTWLNQAIAFSIKKGLIIKPAHARYQIARSAIESRSNVCLHAFLRGRDCAEFKNVRYEVETLRGLAS